MKLKLISLALTLLLVLSATAALAEVQPGFYIAPLFGGTVFEGDLDLEDKSTVAPAIGYNFTEAFGVEAVFSRTATETESTGNDVDVDAYHLDALLHLAPKATLVPYLAAGLGGITTDPDGGRSDDKYLVNYGGGLQYFLGKNIALRGDVRHMIALDETDNLLRYGVGLTFQFADSEPAPAPAPAPPDDSDGDGVIDSRDKCPDTPKRASVDANGCPVDSDKDGVADYLDKCPDTPRGTKVDSNGCPRDLDADGDGVLDSLDKCPGTAKGVMVDAKGCPLSFTLHLEFDFDKADIRPEYHDQLADAAAFMKDNPAPQFLIAGHTDDRGEAEYNNELSLRRAEAVRQYLIDNFGADGDKLIARGFGESQPVADNATEAGMQQNRRVEVVCCVVVPE